MPLYFDGSEEEEESEYISPSIDNEREPKWALVIVYRRPMSIKSH